MTDVVVVGAGIVGSSVAYHLARQGSSVTLIDQGSSPAAGVTGGSFAWIGGSGREWPGGAEDLRESVLPDYRRLEAELPGVTVRWTGSVTWTAASDQPGNAPRLGPGQHWIGRSEIAALEPHLHAPPVRAVHTPTDGAVDPVAVTEALVHAARARGARVLLGTAVTALKTAGGRVAGVTSSAGFHPASTVVLAAGTRVPALCEPLGVSLPVAASPAFLMHVSAPPGLVKTIVANPDFEARELREGHLLVPAPHRGDWTAQALEQRAQHTLRRLRTVFHASGPCRLLGYRARMRPMPANGPMLGRPAPQSSVYVAVTHSAVALAPTVGRLVADELVTGTPADELRRCRPRRHSR